MPTFCHWGKDGRSDLYKNSKVNWNKHTKDPAECWDPVLTDVFETQAKIGRGTYGNVFKAKAPSGKAVAIKQVLAEADGFPITAIREIKMLRAFDHPNIISLLDVVSTSSDTSRSNAKIYLIFDYCDHDLTGLQADPTIQFLMVDIKYFLQQILQAIDYLHNTCKILHRDIKASNVLVTRNGEVKLADFGLARQFMWKRERRQYTVRVVTLWYRAPELILSDNRYGPPVDMWSVGCVFGEMLAGKSLFTGKTDIEQFSQICEICGTPTKENWPGYKSLMDNLGVMPSKIYNRCLRNQFQYIIKHGLGELGMQLLDGLLTMDPSKRWTARQCLDSPFFKEKPYPAARKWITKKGRHEYTTRLERKERREKEKKRLLQQATATS